MSRASILVSMSFEQMEADIIAAFKKDPQEVIYVPWLMLVASAAEGTKSSVSAASLKKTFRRYLAGKLNGKYELYDAATSLCIRLADCCFGTGPEDDNVSFTMKWIEHADGTFTVALRAA